MRLASTLVLASLLAGCSEGGRLDAGADAQLDDAVERDARTPADTTDVPLGDVADGGSPSDAAIDAPLSGDAADVLPPPDGFDVCAPLDLGSAPLVLPTLGSGTAPPATGGTLQDGRYELTAAALYGMAGTPMQRVKFVVEIRGTEWRMVLASEGSPPESTGGRLEVSGTNLTLRPMCPSAPPDPMGYAYSAATSSLVLQASDPASGATLVWTFDRR